jgi:hypothetical protein
MEELLANAGMLEYLFTAARCLAAPNNFLHGHQL